MRLRLHISILLPILTSVCVSAQRDVQIQRIVPRKQVALVIGNGEYVSVNKLKNPVNDADAMARQLRELNYDVLLVREASRRQMGEKIDEFIGQLGAGDVALFYYAGHGVQLDGENYLIPVDFTGNSESDVRYDTFPVGKIQDRMEHSGAQLNILVLDACRTNPFRFRSRAGTNGWAAMDAGRGTYIAFATAPNSVASDNSDAPNGLFTQYLLQALGAPGLGLDDVFNLVRARVDAASNSKQLPWTHSSVVGQYIFRPGAESAISANAPPPLQSYAVFTYLETDFGGRPCSLSPGDIIRSFTAPRSDGSVPVTVVASPPGDCPENSVVTVSAGALDEMDKHLTEEIRKMQQGLVKEGRH